jgi:glycosyltransferase involved in cell wall biosynthesis
MLPTARLLIVGDGPDREHLEREIASRELTSRVILTGPAAPEHMPAMLASMNVAVAPYPALTPFYHSPIKVYEFMAAGLPIVASRIGQIEEIIQHGETGLLIRPGDANALTLALCELAGDVQLRDRLGHAAREAVSNHTWDDLVAYVISLLGLAPAHSPVSEAVPAALSA